MVSVISDSFLDSASPSPPSKCPSGFVSACHNFSQHFEPRIPDVPYTSTPPCRAPASLGWTFFGNVVHVSLQPLADLDWYTRFLSGCIGAGGHDGVGKHNVDSLDSLSLLAESLSPQNARNRDVVARPCSPISPAQAETRILDDGGGSVSQDKGSAFREMTRSFVLSMDFRRFAKDTCDFHSDTNELNVSKTLGLYARTFPQLKCILLDGHAADLDLTYLAQAQLPCLSPRTQTSCSELAGPALLSLRRYPVHLPSRFFYSAYLRNLVYLDVSYIPGSVKTEVEQGSLSPSRLPGLRILKVRGREMDDAAVDLLLSKFETQLWSLDACDNNLTDGTLDALLHWAFTPVTRQGTALAAAAHFEAEGMLQVPFGLGSDSYGPYKFVVESELSGTYTHSERYFADAPTYPQGRGGRPRPSSGDATASRMDGLVPIRQDDVESVKKGFEDAETANSSPYLSCHGHAEPGRTLRDTSAGLTHLYLSGNPKITAQGLERLLRCHPGTLQRLSCDTVTFQPPASPSSRTTGIKAAQIIGLIGSSYVFRPIFASDLRELRVHHSLVTLVPTLVENDDAFSSSSDQQTLRRLWRAENVLALRVEMAFPLRWEPDMNPRVTKLTLTNIPRRSSGRVVREICKLIKAASVQERGIKDCETGKRRGVPVLKGLRHLVLEFEPDPNFSGVGHEDDQGGGGGGDGGEGEMLVLGEEEFSFFEDENKVLSSDGGDATRSDVEKKTTLAGTGTWSSSSFAEAYPPMPTTPPPLGTKLTRFPYDQPILSSSSSTSLYPDSEKQKQQQFQYLSHTSRFGGKSCFLHVWIGNGIMGPYPAVNEYMLRVAYRPNLRSRVGPASPVHVRAGVPAGSYIFHAAWDDIVVDPYRSGSGVSGWHAERGKRVSDWHAESNVKVPGREEMKSTMVDTVEAIKAYRRKTRRALEEWLRGGNGSVNRKSWRNSGLGPPHHHWSGRVEVVLRGKEMW